MMIARQIEREARVEVARLFPVRKGDLSQSLGAGRLRSYSLEEWRRFHADGVEPPLEVLPLKEV